MDSQDNLKEGWYNKLTAKMLDHVKYEEAYALAERYLLTNRRQDRDKLASYSQGDQRILIPIALDYMDKNLFEEAGKILSLIDNKNVKTELLKAYAANQGKTLCPRNLVMALDYSLDDVYVNEPKVVSILEEHQGADFSGVIDYLLGSFYYSVGRKDESLAKFLLAYEKGLRYTVLLRNIGCLYYNYKNDSDTAVKYFEEDVRINNETSEISLMYLNRIRTEKENLEK